MARVGAVDYLGMCGMDSLLDWSLVTGPLPVVLLLAGGAALLALGAVRGDRRWWTRTVPLVGLVTAAVVGATALAVTLAAPFPDPLPLVVWGSVGVGVGAVALGVAVGIRGRTRVRARAALAVVVVLLAAANQVNTFFGEYPTIRTALGLAPIGQVDFAQVTTGAPLVIAPEGQPLASVWRPPPGMPATGRVSEVVIPATVSRFAARPAWLYLPPAYLSRTRAQLPVLVLLGGQPGEPRSWLDGGRLAAMLDRFAAAHDGLAPVAVLPDNLGSRLANPLCVDSHLGKVATYLAVDVPTWIRSTLQIDTAPGSWAIGGFSAGGTCALQLATNAPRVYPTFIDISGQIEPTLGTRARTVDAVFAGNAAAFTAINPLDLLATHRYPQSAGTVVVGTADPTYRAEDQQVAAAARRAGMTIVYRELPGGHTWHVWGPGLETSLPWLAHRLRLTP